MHQNTILTCSEGFIIPSPKSVTVAERSHLLDATVNKVVKIWHQEVSSIGYGLASLTVGPNPPSEEKALSCLRTAAELGCLV